MGRSKYRYLRHWGQAPWERARTVIPANVSTKSRRFWRMTSSLGGARGAVPQLRKVPLLSPSPAGSGASRRLTKSNAPPKPPPPSTSLPRYLRRLHLFHLLTSQILPFAEHQTHNQTPPALPQPRTSSPRRWYKLTKRRRSFWDAASSAPTIPSDPRATIPLSAFVCPAPPQLGPSWRPRLRSWTPWSAPSTRAAASR